MTVLDTDPAANLDAAVRRVAALLDQMPDAPDALEAAEADWGRFAGGEPQIELQPDNRTSRLLSPFAYFRPDRSHWPVPVGAFFDGASIPRVFWTLIGSPYVGAYRKAAIVHDHYCVVKARRWQDTHRMFYEAMRCDGVGKSKAGVMYYAVRRFGPRWPLPGLEALPADVAPAPWGDAVAVSFAADAEAILRQNLSADAIEVLADVHAA